MTTKNNLVVLDKTTYELTNKQLVCELHKIEKAEKLGDNARWLYAESVSNIINGELFKDDFRNLEKFAQFLGMSKGALSQYDNAYKYISANGYNKNNVSVGIAYLLSTQDNNFVKFLNSKGYEVEKVSVKTLRDVIKQYNSNQIETSVENENNEAAEKEKKQEIVEITYKRHTYQIPLKVLEKYLVK